MKKHFLLLKISLQYFFSKKYTIAFAKKSKHQKQVKLKYFIRKEFRNDHSKSKNNNTTSKQELATRYWRWQAWFIRSRLQHPERCTILKIR